MKRMSNEFDQSVDQSMMIARNNKAKKIQGVFNVKNAMNSEMDEQSQIDPTDQ